MGPYPAEAGGADTKFISVYSTITPLSTTCVFYASYVRVTVTEFIIFLLFRFTKCMLISIT